MKTQDLERRIAELESKLADLTRRKELAADGAVSVEDAMAFLNLGMTEVYELNKTGVLPYAKLGRRRVIPRRALVDHLAANIVVDEGVTVGG